MQATFTNFASLAMAAKSLQFGYAATSGAYKLGSEIITRMGFYGYDTAAGIASWTWSKMPDIRGTKDQVEKKEVAEKDQVEKDQVAKDQVKKAGGKEGSILDTPTAWFLAGVKSITPVRLEPITESIAVEGKEGLQKVATWKALGSHCLSQLGEVGVNLLFAALVLEGARFFGLSWNSLTANAQYLSNQGVLKPALEGLGQVYAWGVATTASLRA